MSSTVIEMERYLHIQPAIIYFIMHNKGGTAMCK